MDFDLIIGGSDYMPTQQMLTFDNETELAVFNVSILDDSSLEAVETFSITMSLPLPSTNVQRDTIVVVINDDDGKH